MEKHIILQDGRGLYHPNDRSTVTVSVNCSDREQGKMVLSKEKHCLVLGEPENELWYMIEKCIMSMREGEEKESVLRVNEVEILCQLKLISFKRSIDFWWLHSDQKLILAGQYKVSGNNQFKNGHYKMAAMFYSKSLKCLISIGSDDISVTELKLVYLSNLAACQLKLNRYRHCIENCTKVLQKQPLNVKALFRRGSAYLDSGELELAEVDLLKAKQLERDSKIILTRLNDLQTAKETVDKKYQESMKKMFAGKPK